MKFEIKHITDNEEEYAEIIRIIDRWRIKEEILRECNVAGCREDLVLVDGLWMCPIHDKKIIAGGKK